MRYTLLICVASSILSLVAGAQAPTVPDEFRNPPSAFRPSPFWSWNSALDDEELRWQVREFKDKGYGGYFMHPRVGLVTRYLSDDFFHKVAVCLEEGRKLNLQSWIYDEDKWPSGFAGGLATVDRPEFVAMGMGFKDIAADQVGKALEDPEMLGVFNLSSGGYRRVAKGDKTAGGQFVEFYAQHHQKSNWYNGETYIDTLNPEAVAHFLKITFTDGYNPRFRSAYGPAMPGVFTDEPNFRAAGRGRTVFPWTPRFAEAFRTRRGYDLLEKLPLLIQPLPGFEQVRYDFRRTATELFEEAYSIPYGEMLEKLGLKYTGHYLNEDTLSMQTRVIGSAMLHYVHQHIPGIDHLQRNIANPLTKKQASSVANQFGRNRVLSEIYGGSGHTASFEDLKWMSDNHYVLGVNLLAPHLSLYAMAGDRKRDYPPTFSYHQPYWPYMALINDYLGRAAYFTTRGKPQQEILLLEPLGSVWAYWNPETDAKSQEVAEQELRFITAFDTLLKQHRDFDLGDEIILERYGRVNGNELRVGPEGRYKLVVVPPAYRWNQSTIRLLEEHLNSGGKVIFQGMQPSTVKPLLSHRNASFIGDQPGLLSAALDSSFQRDISITGADGQEIGDILYLHRAEGTRQYFFLANMSREKTHEAVIKLAPALYSGEITQWDLSSGTLRRGSLRHSFPPVGSYAFTVDTGLPASTASAKETRREARTVAISGPYKFQREQPNTLVLDTCHYVLNDEPEVGPVPVWKVRQAAFKTAGLGAFAGLQPWAMEWKGIKPDKTARVKMSFEFESDLEQPKAWLVLEKAGNFDCNVNGQPAGGADGWHWDKQFGKINIGGKVHKGKNLIELSTVYKLGVEIEDIFVIGDFATRKTSDTSYALAPEPAALNAGNWVEQGYHFYAGNMVYLIPVRYEVGQRVVLRLAQPSGTGFLIRSSGRAVAQIGWQPWEADVTSALRPGDNLLELVVLGSLQNSFGPLHNDRYQKSGNNWSFGPEAFTDVQHWTDRYYHAPYGFGSVGLSITK
jgi:hypothetical protein